MRKKLRKLKNQLNKNTVSKNTVKEYQIEYKDKIKEAKKESWENFISNIDDAKETSKLLKMLGKNNTNEIGLLQNENGTYCTSPKESLELLMNKHFPNYKNTCNYQHIKEWSSDENCELRITKDIVKNTFKK